MGASAILPNPCSEKNQRVEGSENPPHLPSSSAEPVHLFFSRLGISRALPEASAKRNFAETLVRSALKLETADPGRVTFSMTVFPQITNFYDTLHGGAVGVVAEVVAQTCLMTVAGEREFFLGESSVSYLSASRIDEQLCIDGYVLKQGRNVIVVSLEFKVKNTEKLTYVGHFTYYAKAPHAKL